jgi:dienelactone hydrolase
MNFALLGIAMTTITLHDKPVQIPDPLTRADGTKVPSAEHWHQEQRLKTLEQFRTHVYGRAPIGKPADLKFETQVTPNMMDGKATRKLVKITYSGPGGAGAINLILFVPDNKKPAPCFVLINNRGIDLIDPTREKKSPFWPAEQMIDRGYAAAAFLNADLDADKFDNFKDGVHGLFDDPNKPRATDAWGTIAAWAWGASRVMDYLETDADIDKNRVALVGHSRGGKTALWAGAEDERFALVISNESGSTGAALSRGKVGEHIADINKNFPHWFNENYKTFNGRENELPVDQHQLLALIAPRLLYVASASEDTWADPEAEFKSAVAATPVYELFGFKGVSGELPAIEKPVHDGAIGYHVRQGKHGLNEYDWTQFMNFADKHWKAK